MDEASPQLPRRGTETIGLPTRPQQPPEPRPQIPDYRLIKVIGRGAFGTVWLAEETLVGVFRAVKVLHHPHSTHIDAKDEGGRVSHIERELAGIHAYQTQSQDHPHLVRILKTGVCRVPDTPTRNRQAVYYVMEIADHSGGPQPHRPTDYQPLTLVTLQRQHGRLPGEKVVEIAGNLLGAIDHLHKAGIHHRDIKPSNVLIVGGTLKLADLGLVASENDEPIGTSSYMTPEGTPDDLYALGKVIYQLTTGLLPESFPEWPADLDPASDPLLSPLRSLTNELCHPSKNKRLTNIRTTRRRLGSSSRLDPTIRISRRSAVAGLLGASGIGIVTGLIGSAWWVGRSDPTRWRYGRTPFNGDNPEQNATFAGKAFSLMRHHRPGSILTTSGTGATMHFLDIETGLIDGRLAVSGAFQIYNQGNPIRGDITTDRGELNQIYLIAGDSIVLLYHGQPGAKPGVRSRFGARGRRAIPLHTIARQPNGIVDVHLAYCGFTTPQLAESYFAEGRREGFHRVTIAQLGWSSRPNHPTKP